MQAQALYQAPEVAQPPRPEIVAITPPPAPPQSPAAARPSPSTPPPPAAACAPAAAAGTAMAHVLLPHGAAAGQQVQFVPPGGHQPMRFVVPTAVAAQSTVVVQYPAPQLPVPIVDHEAEEEDRSAARRQWMLYGCGFPVCCLVGPLFAVCLWGAVAAWYYMQPGPAPGRRSPRRGPARAALATAAATCACLFVAAAFAVAVAAACGGDLEHCDLGKYQAPFYHMPIAPLGGKVNFTLSGHLGPYGHAMDCNQKYLYEGVTKDGRAYYRREHSADAYLYYDRRCGGPRWMPVGAWVVGRRPDLHMDGELEEGIDSDCSYDAMITSADFSLPVGWQKWDWFSCGGRSETGAFMHAAVETDRPSGPAPAAVVERHHLAIQASGLRKTADRLGFEVVV